MKTKKGLLIISMLLLLISPIDLISDFIPVIGQMDDLVYIVVAALQLLCNTKQIAENTGRH